MISVKRKEIIRIDMVENENNDFCVRFHLNRGEIILPCFYRAGFSLGYFPEQDARQLQLTQAYLDSHESEDFVQLSATHLYDMNVYH